MSKLVLRSTLAVVAALALGSAATFAGVAHATHHPASSLVGAVLTGQDLPPASRSFAFVPGKYYEGSRAVGESDVWLLPVDPQADLLARGWTPPLSSIRVRTADGEIQTCLHSGGAGVTTDGVPVTGDGWTCTRRIPPTVVPSPAHQ